MIFFKTITSREFYHINISFYISNVNHIIIVKTGKNKRGVMKTDIIKVMLTALFSLIALFVMTKIMGNKQMSQITMFDYIIGISIGSIAAEMATELEKPARPLIAMFTYAVSALIISLVTEKSVAVICKHCF